MSLSFNHHGVTEITERVEIGRNFGYFFSSISNNLSVLSDSVVNNDIMVYLIVSFAMFAIGVIGVLAKRNALIMFLSIELMLNASNLLFVAFAREKGDTIGLVWVFFVLVLAAAEAAVGLAIIINLFRSKQIVDVDQYNELRG